MSMISALVSAGSWIRRNVHPLNYRRNYSLEKTHDEKVSVLMTAWVQTYTPSYDAPVYGRERNERIYDIVGWQKGQNRAWWIIRSILTLPQNLAKFFSIFIPNCLEKYLGKFIEYCRELIEDDRKDRRKVDHLLAGKKATIWYPIGLGFVIFLASVLYYAFKATRYLGRALFAPWDHAKAGWEAGYKTQSIRVVESLEITVFEGECLTDGNGNYILWVGKGNDDFTNLYRTIARTGNGKLQVDENGDFVLTGESLPADRFPGYDSLDKRRAEPSAESSDDAIPDESQLASRNPNTLPCERIMTRDVLVDREGRLIDSNGCCFSINYISYTDPSSGKECKAEPAVQVSAFGNSYVVSQEISNSGPQKTWKNWVYGAFNALTSIALIFVTFKFLAGSVATWIAEKMSLTAIEAAQLPSEIATAMEVTTAVTVAARLPNVGSQLRDACCRQDKASDSADSIDYEAGGDETAMTQASGAHSRGRATHDQATLGGNNPVSVVFEGPRVPLVAAAEYSQ